MVTRLIACLLITASVIGLTSPFAPATAEGEGVSPGRHLPGVEGSQSRNYSGRDYDRIKASLRSTVALARRVSHRRFASGTLLARDLVLTCRHCTHRQSRSRRRRPPDQLEVQIDDRRLPVLEYAHTSESYDLCVLRIGPDESGWLPEADRIRTLSVDRAPLGAPIYVIHHPEGGAVCVADDARILYPYEATHAELELMQDRLRRQAGSAEHAADLLEQLRVSYRPQEGGLFRNHSLQWARQPTIGADCRTFDGSSGAPVYDKRTHAFIGILFAGVDQTQARIPSTWQHHEAVLPAAAILEDLAQSADEPCRRLACSNERQACSN